MKIKQCLSSFPLGVISFICLLVGIVCWNNYLNDYQHQIALKHLTVSTTMLNNIETESERGIGRIIADKLTQLKYFEKNINKVNNFSQVASIFILIGSLLLGGIFFYNLNNITRKLNELTREIENVNRKGLDEYELNYSFDGGNEIDCLAGNLEKVLRNFKQSNREKNGLLRLLQQSNKQLKQQLEMQCS